MKNPFRKDNHGRNHAKAVMSRDCLSSRDKRFETRLEMGELSLESKERSIDKGRSPDKCYSGRSSTLMREIV